MKIGIASDHKGFRLKETLKAFLLNDGYALEDKGTPGEESCDYPDSGSLVAQAVSESSCDRGILICSTGIGMSVVAHKFPGVRAGLCGTVETARQCREHLDANVLVLAGSSQVLGCPGAVSAAMALADLVRGKTLSEALEVKDRDVFRRLVQIPDQKQHCIRLAVKTLEKAIKEYEDGHAGKAA